jgi:deoxyribonuclease-4
VTAPERPGGLLGAHVSSQGGVVRAPERGRAIGATAIQLFTKTPNQWREPALTPETGAAFQAALAAHGIAAAVSHDSYLINLASPDPVLRRRSEESFVRELTRCRTLGIRWVVSHPGNHMGDRDAGLARNAESYARCLAMVEGDVHVAIETTAGSGTALGARFEELAALMDRLPPGAQSRVGFCADTCHLFAAGYDLASDFDGVWDAFHRLLGLDRLVVLHLNDSRGPLGGRLDRHAIIGRGRLGPEAFRRVMSDPRFHGVMKLLETPKGADGVSNDRRALRRLRGWAGEPRNAGAGAAYKLLDWER